VRIWIGKRRAVAERLKSPQRLRNASQTARGFNSLDNIGRRCPEGRRRAWHPPAPDPSAKADFANFQRRIHSLRRGRGDYPVQVRDSHHSLRTGLRRAAACIAARFAENERL
jgi:hypothetical protein